MTLSRPFKEDRLALYSFHTSLLQMIDGVMLLALCSQVVSQASQYFKSSEKQANCEGCFARQSICSIISLYCSMSRAIGPQEFWKGNVDRRHILVWDSLSSIHFL